VTERGMFIISLDFELHWGIRDHAKVEERRGAMLGERAAVPMLLRLFDEYGVHATWAVPGFLFFATRGALLRGLPSVKPRYADMRLSPYEDLSMVGRDEKQDPFHFAPSLIRQIQASANQEIATHTLSHYYCLEPGQDVHCFKADLEAAFAAAQPYGITFDSIVFPRNEVQDTYLSVLLDMGIRAYRGCARSWLYRSRRRGDEHLLVRGLRLLDSYLPLSGRRSYAVSEVGGELPCNLMASRYLRPWSPRLGLLNQLRLTRITRELSAAAASGGAYHLWWHPQDFGNHLVENLTLLQAILEHFQALRQEYGMVSVNMREAANVLFPRGPFA